MAVEGPGGVVRPKVSVSDVYQTRLWLGMAFAVSTEATAPLQYCTLSATGMLGFGLTVTVSGARGLLHPVLSLVCAAQKTYDPGVSVLGMKA